jgi:apolipoprotein N-acyltransferase
LSRRNSQNARTLAFPGFWGKLPPVRNSASRSLIRSRYPPAILAGLLLAASLPKIGIAGLAWIAPALMLAAALGKGGWESFRIGYVAGLAYYLASLYWLLLIPYRWHSIPVGPAAGWLALSAYLALYPATWVWLLARVPGPKATIHNLGAARPSWLLEGFGGLLARTWAQRTLWALSGAALWVALEMIVARLFSGFPWNLLGSSQYEMVPLIQIASVTGVYGVSFLLVWTSLCLVSAGLMVVLRPSLRSAWVGEIILPLVVVTLVFSFGFRQLAGDTPSNRTLKVTLVQPSIPQTLIWDTSRDLERFREFIRLSEQALTNRTDLLVWPESAVPSYARWDTNIYPAITNLVRQHHVWLILGSDDVGRPPHPTRADEYEYYNASFLVTPDGDFVSRYVKRNLVVFGEYIPLVRWLPFVKWFTPIEGGFTPGNRTVPFALTNLDVKTSTLICFEDMFPFLAREAADEDTDFLVNLTNNGWFGESAAQWQHAAGALFRAVENGLPLIRCSNNGLTGWVDARGRLRQVFRDDRGTIYGPGFMTAEIPLLARGEKRPPTFYHRHGDWFGWVCMGVAGLIVVRRVRLALDRPRRPSLLFCKICFESLREGVRTIAVSSFS